MRATGICNTFGRGATMITPYLVVRLLRSSGIGGVLGLMVGLLIVQILVFFFLGVEPKKRRLEEMDEASPYALAPCKSWRLIDLGGSIGVVGINLTLVVV